MTIEQRSGPSETKTRTAKPAVERERVAVLIPALNEEKSIALVLKSIPRQIVSQVVVIDNGSTDRTSEVATLAGAEVVHEPQRGYGAACLAGIRKLKADASIVVFLDADYSDFPEELNKLVQPLADNRADLVIGTRTRDRKARAALTPQQRFGNWLAVRLMHLFWGCRYTDLGPFRAIRRSSFELLSMADRNYGWTVEMQIKAALTGLRTLEIPVRYRTRIGQSKVSGTVKGTILAGMKILYTIFRYASLTLFQRGRLIGAE